MVNLDNDGGCDGIVTVHSYDFHLKRCVLHCVKVCHGYQVVLFEKNKGWHYNSSEMNERQHKRKLWLLMSNNSILNI